MVTTKVSESKTEQCKHENRLAYLLNHHVKIKKKRHHNTIFLKFCELNASAATNKKEHCYENRLIILASHLARAAKHMELNK